MTEKHDKFVCESCGHVEERDSGWAEAMDPSPEVNIMATMPGPPVVEPIEKKAQKESEYYDVGLGFALGDCDECGGHSWQRISLSSLEKEDPKPETTEETEDAPKDKGFSEVIPPSPEVSQGSVMMQVDYNPPPVKDAQDKDVEDKDLPDKDKYACEKCGDVLELELGQTEMPACVHCGSHGWLKESF